MANWYVDTSASGGNNGTTPEDAWQDYDTALSSTGFAAGDKVWFRRNQSSIPTSDITMAETSGTPASPIVYLAHPRAAKTGTGDFENGSHCVTDVSFMHATDPAIDRLRYMARRIKNDADGKYYMITAILVKLLWDGDTAHEAPEFEVGDIVEGVTSGCWGKIHKLTDNGDGTGTMWLVTYNATTGLPDVYDNNENLEVNGDVHAVANGNGVPDGFFIIDEFAGSTEGDGNCTIEADDYVSDIPAAIQDDVGTNVDWTGDTDELPTIDFNTTAYQWKAGGGYSQIIQGFAVKDTSDVWGNMDSTGFNTGKRFKMILLHNKNNCYGVANLRNSALTIEQMVITGLSGAGVTQKGLGASIEIYIKNLSIYGVDDTGIYMGQDTLCDINNVNVGLELPNGNSALEAPSASNMHFTNFKFADDNGLWEGYRYYGFNRSGVELENYNKILGVHRTAYEHIYLDRNDCSGADVNARSGGSTTVLEITSNNGDYTGLDEINKTECFEWLFTELSAASHTIKVYIQNTAQLTMGDAVDGDDIWLEVEYPDTYDDTSEYHYAISRGTSTQAAGAIAARADADDWAEYLTATFIPAVANSNVRVRLYSTWYDAGDSIYIDLKPSVT